MGGCEDVLARPRDRWGVELLATRRSDGKTLAVEHTLLEPFVGEKGDFAQFKQEFPRIAEDESLRAAMVSAVHQWLKVNRLSLPDGDSQHQCPVPEMPGDQAFEITLTIKISRLGGPLCG